MLFHKKKYDIKYLCITSQANKVKTTLIKNNIQDSNITWLMVTDGKLMNSENLYSVVYNILVHIALLHLVDTNSIP